MGKDIPKRKPFEYDVHDVIKSDFKRSQFDPEVMISGVANYTVGPVRSTYEGARDIATATTNELREYLVERAKEWMAAKGYKAAKP